MDRKEQIQKIRAFNRFYTDLIGLLDNQLLHSDYSLAEARIFYEIVMGKSISASDIIAKLNIDKGYLSRILKKFEKQGLLCKEPSKSDARIAYLSLTAAGLQVFKGLDRASDEQIRHLVDRLDEQKVIELVGHMKSIFTILSPSEV
ncbi:MarR family winged helix-turn-helix transcriptional regulator [Mucilaginibacter pocheonensis]|uniref:DNA-binding MarR family transcriptional regulator n=1 Tax=Mucilaginibacter pocheonensis TaxID=398050 RepID=A0ABU1T6G4_9SPHI|nr:MarR family winged helix-turn-helix transcriptional regulator [Mucilaginibacter pocheonensis]MDR6940928.1 DNA-binding MarR family transcriptional regulator [Mucilaginibacter pocheonensis]